MKTRFSAIIFSLGAAALIMACGPKGSGPSIPSTTSSADQAPQSSNETPSPATGEAPAAELDTSSPYDATVAHRLQALPATVQEKVKACEAGGTFYNLGDQLCTELVPVSFPCVINDEFKTRIDPTTVAPLEEYLTTKAAAHRLYACTEEGANITLHFYKFEDGVVNYKKLNIAKKAN